MMIIRGKYSFEEHHTIHTQLMNGVNDIFRVDNIAA